jgi:hypothetical protein
MHKMLPVQLPPEMTTTHALRYAASDPALDVEGLTAFPSCARVEHSGTRPAYFESALGSARALISRRSIARHKGFGRWGR